MRVTQRSTVQHSTAQHTVHDLAWQAVQLAQHAMHANIAQASAKSNLTAALLFTCLDGILTGGCLEVDWRLSYRKEDGDVIVPLCQHLVGGIIHQPTSTNTSSTNNSSTSSTRAADAIGIGHVVCCAMAVVAAHAVTAMRQQLALVGLLTQHAGQVVVTSLRWT